MHQLFFFFLNLFFYYTAEGQYSGIRAYYVTFSDWAEFFLGFSHFLNNEMTNNLYVCHSLIV